MDKGLMPAWVQAGAAIITFCVTAWYAFITHRISKSSAAQVDAAVAANAILQEQLNRSVQPRLDLRVFGKGTRRFEDSIPQMIWVTVTNNGLGKAFNVRVGVTGDNDFVLKPDVSNAENLTKPIDPDGWRNLAWDGWDSAGPGSEARGFPDWGVTITLEFDDVFGRPFRGSTRIAINGPSGAYEVPQVWAPLPTLASGFSVHHDDD